MAKILYIIGNGFDQHHGLKTCYEDFRVYLEINNPDLYKEISTIYGVDVNMLWSDFEAKLSELYHRFDDIANYSYTLTEFAPKYEDDEYGSIDLQTELSKITYDFNNLKIELQATFESWIYDTYIEWINNKPKFNKLSLDKDALYLTFNHTKCLQDCYEIPEENILHIHNSIADIRSENLIYGHGDMNIPLDTIDNPLLETSWGKQAENIISEFHNKLRKDTESIIRSNINFFNRLKDVDSIFILGHSCNNIDKPYFERIRSSVSDSAKWYISYYINPEDSNIRSCSDLSEFIDNSIGNFVDDLNIDHYEPITISDQ